MRAGAGRGRLKNALLPLLVLAAGTLLTWAATQGSVSTMQAEDRAQFIRQADLLEHEVERRLQRAVYGLRGLRATYAVTRHLDSAELRRYVHERDFAGDFPGVRGFGVIERVARSDLDAFVAGQRSGGQPHFLVRTSGNLPDLLVVRSIEPLEHNREALGFDSGSHPVAREALERAIDSGLPTLTAPLTLQQDDRQGLGWVMYVPIYRGAPRSPDERRRSLEAVLFAPMVADEVLGGSTDLIRDESVFRLLDGAGERRVVFDGLAARGTESPPRHAVERTMLVGQRRLVLDVQSTRGLAERPGRVMPWVIAIAGSGLSVFLALVTWLLAAGKMQALTAAAAMSSGMLRLAGIVERSAGAVFTTDLQGRLTWVNRGFEQITGLQQRQVMGQSALQVLRIGQAVPHDERRALWRDLEQGRSHRLEFASTRPAGERFWAEVAVQPERDAAGKLTGYVGIALDITRRKEAELQRRASEHLTRLIADNVPARISYWDSQDRCLFANQRWHEVHGLGPHQVLNRSYGEIFGARVPAGRDERVRDVLQGLPLQFEQRLREADGRQTDWQMHYIPDLEGNTVNGFFVLAHEVTELKKARDLALQASQAKSRFLSSMSHEIRTPMNAVLGMLTLLRATPLTERQEDYAGKAEGAARALLSLLNDVLDFSKIEAGKMQLDCRPFSLETTFAELSVILSANVGTKDIEVLYELDPRVPQRLVGDDMRLRQILINLGGNAVKFTARGEVLVRTRLLRCEQGRATIEFSVQDSGIGMSPEQQQQLFTDFAQASGETARQFGGTGLGLGICRRLAEMMGSQIELRSALGHGSCFSFELALPVDDAPVAAPAAGSIERVLVVDDNQLARESLAGLAASHGWQVDTAASGDAAVALLAGGRDAGRHYDAVFIDWRMPGLDGWQASLRIRALPTGARTPLLVMVTAHGREMLARRPAQEQALLDGFLVKPVTASMLREAVERAAGRPPRRADGTLGRQPLAGMRLLLAEDNPVNQQIARELLTAQGAGMVVADNGRQAVDRLAAGERYDAVLMDVLMPVMDGLAATACIRGELGLDTLPVIAMTANAMDSDRAECLAAGMNDHVSKPIVLAEVVSALLRHVRDRTAPAGTPAPAAAPAAQDVLLDREGTVQRLGGDPALYEQLLPLFRGNLAQSAQALREAQACAAREEMVRTVHSIKGMAGNMGALRLARAAQRAEHRLLENAEAGSELHEVALAIDATLAEIGPCAEGRSRAAQMPTPGRRIS